MKLSQAVDGFIMAINADGYSTVTSAYYRRYMNRVTEYLDDPDLDAVKTDDLRGFLSSLRSGGLCGSSVQMYWKVIRSFFNFAKDYISSTRPDSGIPAPKFEHKVIIPFVHHEIDKLVKKCPNLRAKAIVYTLLDTGLRASELCRLTLKEVNLQDGIIQVIPFQTGKKSKGRQVYLGKASRRINWQYLTTRDADPSSPFIATKQNRFLDRNQLAHILRRIGVAAGVLDTHPHKFRHTFAIEYLRNGGDIFTLQRLLGHSSLEMVKHYLNISDGDAENAHRKASPADRWRL